MIYIKDIWRNQGNFEELFLLNQSLKHQENSLDINQEYDTICIINFDIYYNLFCLMPNIQ